MPTRTKRSERIGINLTPQQNQQLQDIARQAQQTPAGYVYDLVRQALETKAPMTTTHVSNTPDWAEQIADLYGLLDVLMLQLEHSTNSTEQISEKAALQPSLREVNERIAETQAILLSIHSSLVEHG